MARQLDNIAQRRGSPVAEQTVLIRHSKTDQESKGTVQFLGKPTTERIQAWLRNSRLAEGPLFCGVNKARRVRGRRLTDRTIRIIIKKRAKAAGVDGRVNGHGLRVGSAQSLANAGASLVEMQVAGRWRSPAMPGLYAQGQLAKQGAVAGSGMVMSSTPHNAERRGPAVHSERIRGHIVREDIRADAVRDPECQRLHRTPRQMSLASGSLHLGVAQQLTDHRKTLRQAPTQAARRFRRVVGSAVARRRRSRQGEEDAGLVERRAQQVTSSLSIALRLATARRLPAAIPAPFVRCDLTPSSAYCSVYKFSPAGSQKVDGLTRRSISITCADSQAAPRECSPRRIFPSGPL